jgi:hypothetical protein
VEQDNHYRIIGEVDHGEWTHRRELVLRPGHWLWVRDDVHSTSGTPHDFRVWWNLPESLSQLDASSTTVAFGAPEGPAPVSFCSLDGAEIMPPVHGQQEPLRGWRSRRDRELTPAWSFAFMARHCSEHQFSTLITLDGTSSGAVPPSPFAEARGASYRP